MGAEMNRKKKEGRISFHTSQGKVEIGLLSKRDLLLAGLGIYWGEGTKAGNSQTSVVNSDPRIIAFMARWLKEYLGIPNTQLNPRIFINESHSARNEVLVDFWAGVLAIPASQFANTVFLKMKNKKIYENSDSYYGVLALRVRKSTDLKYRILGLIDALSEAKRRGSSVG